MLSRIFWIVVAGLAVVVGMALQDGNRGLLSWDWDSNDRHHEAKPAGDVDAIVDRAIDRGFDRMEVVGSDGEEIAVPADTKRALASAIGELAKAKAQLAMLRIGDEGDNSLAAAEARADQARAEVDRLEAEIRRLERDPANDDEALRDQIRQEVRDDVRAAVKEAVRP